MSEHNVEMAAKTATTNEPVAHTAPGPTDPGCIPCGPLNRRTMLAAGGVVGASAALLTVAACGAGSSDSGKATAVPTDGQGGEPVTNVAQMTLGPASAVPVGGGEIFPAQKVVVTQPTTGIFHAFSAICTHKGCTVGSVSGGTINCPCHGSKFRIADGSVAHGPATAPLPAKQVSLQNGQLTVS